MVINIFLFFRNTALVLKYNQNYFFPFVKLQPFLLSDYFGSVGGIIGLVAGGSVISLVELIYHLAYRPSKNKFMKNWNTKVQPFGAKPRFRTNKDHVLYQLTKFVKEYISKSDIHGFQYLVDSHQSMCERIFWLIVLSIAVTFCSVITIYIYRHREQNPVVIKIDEKVWKTQNVELKFYDS